MACPINHCIPTSAFLPAIKSILGLQNYQSNILLTDYFSKYSKKFGILRDEMIVVMSSVMLADALTKLDNLDYI
jgi:hypothetical protein